MRVQRVANGNRHAAQKVTPFGQVAILKLQQTRNFTTTCHGRCQLHRFAAFLLKVQAHPATARILRGLLHAELCCVQAQHQRLAAADEQTDGAITGIDLRGLHIFVDIAHQLVALIQQIIGRMACGNGTADLSIEPCNLLRQAVDHIHVIAHLLACAVVHLIELSRCRTETRG